MANSNKSNTTKPDAGDDDDVILYMDELMPSRIGNGVSTRAAPTSLILDDDEQPFVESSIVATTLGRRGSRLLETDNTNNPRPTSGPEIDDLEPEVFTNRREHYPGIDDGLLPDPDEDEKPSMVPGSPRLRPGGDIPSFPGFSGAPGTTTPTPDMNVYQQKKTIAQGMMDLALISANANQLRYVLQSSGRHPYYYPSLSMIGLSLFLQVVVGIGLIWNSRYNVKVDDQMCKANRANNWTVIAVFLVTILNVFISSFGVVETSEIIFATNPGS
ncbi:uncharacterized protein LOC100123713 [Nasonia vitripennis]|uniref:Ninjurin-1 n=1 Tax=Nasonia vitripennis TaxID=7425 RepID=A0A7M7G9R5_NASVI|nr:uncharacterized protein LOC100123713 [Nasonia vitripennis]